MKEENSAWEKTVSWWEQREVRHVDAGSWTEEWGPSFEAGKGEKEEPAYPNPWILAL